MSKAPNINSIEDALLRVNNTQMGDQIIVRALTITVPSPAYDMAITNATMELLMANFKNDPNPAKKYDLTMCEAGLYEVVVMFHIRKVDKSEMSLLN